MDKSDLLHRRIAEAAEGVAAAERELEAALAATSTVERAQKEMISSRLESAFARLTATRKTLEAALEDAG